MKQRECIRVLENAGFRLVRITKHHIFRHPDGRVFVLPNQKDVNDRLVKQMLKTLVAAPLIYERNHR